MLRQLHIFVLRVRSIPLSAPVIAVLLIALGPASADVIVLRNQKYLKGTVVSQTESVVVFREHSGQLIQIPKDTIRRMLYLSPAQEESMDRRARQEANARRLKQEKEVAQRRVWEEEQRRAKTARETAQKKRQTEADRHAQERAEKQPKQEWDPRTEALWRSLLIPGWGQYYSNRDRAGERVGAAFLASTLLAIDSQRRFHTTQQDYQSASNHLFLNVLASGTTPNVSLVALDVAAVSTNRGHLRQASTRYNVVFNLLLGVYLWNVTDALNYRFGFFDNLSLDLAAFDGGVGLAFRVRL